MTTPHPCSFWLPSAVLLTAYPCSLPRPPPPTTYCHRPRPPSLRIDISDPPAANDSAAPPSHAPSPHEYPTITPSLVPIVSCRRGGGASAHVRDTQHVYDTCLAPARPCRSRGRHVATDWAPPRRPLARSPRVRVGRLMSAPPPISAGEPRDH